MRERTATIENNDFPKTAYDQRYSIINERILKKSNKKTLVQRNKKTKKAQLADGKSANLYFWKLTNNLRLARNPEGSAASEQMDLRMDDR